METNNTIGERRITIHDMSGTQVEELVFSAENTVNVQGLPSGTYIVKFNGSDGNLLTNQLVILRA